MSPQEAGTDRVVVKFGGTSITRIYDIIVETTANQNPGAFNAATNSDTANDEATLGIVGTSVSSSDENVATAKIEGGKIVITSAGKGSATITVTTTASNSSAEIPVTVDATGAITLGTIVKNSFAGGTHTFTDEEIATVRLSAEPTGMTSSNDKVFTVDFESTTITATGPGEATLTITDGTYSATVAVTVSATGEITLGDVVNPFILDTEEKTLDVSDCGLTTISSATMETGKGTASISDKILTYSVSGFTAAGTAKITLSDGTNEAEVTVTVGVLGEVSAKITKKYVPAGTKVTYKLPLELSELGLDEGVSQWTSTAKISQIGTSIFYGGNVKNENWKITDYSENCGMGAENAATYSWTMSGGKLAKNSDFCKEDGKTKNAVKNALKVTTTGPATVKWWVANINKEDAPVPGVYIQKSDDSVEAATVTDIKRNGVSKTAFEALDSGKSGETDTSGKDIGTGKSTVYLYEFTISAAGEYYFGDATIGKMYTAGLEITF